MSKNVKKVARGAASGKFVERGTKIGKFTAMGTTSDGTVIVAPKQKPKSFSVRELHEVVRSVKDERRRNREGLPS